MTAIEKIKARLSAYPEIKYSEGANEIEVHPSDNLGFSVGFRITPTGFKVNFDGWHDEFTSEDEALACFAFGLSPSCRLAVVFRGNTETKWVVESLKDGKWTPDSETGLLLQPFWRSARILYRHNNLLGRADSIRAMSGDS
jgi:hypothetical protein